MKKLRIPLNVVHQDLEQIQAQWDGKESDINEHRYNLAEEALELVEKLNDILVELDY